MTLSAAQAATIGYDSTYGYDENIDGPLLSKKVTVKSGVAVYRGGHCCMDMDTGYADSYKVRGDYRRVGVFQGDVGSSDTDREVGVELLPVRRNVSVVGVSAIGNVGDQVFIIEDGEGLTLTQQSPGQEPAGEIIGWRQSTFCDVKFHNMEHFLVLRNDRDYEKLYGQDRQRLVKHWNLLPAGTQAVTTDNDIDLTGTSPGSPALQAGGGASLPTGGSSNNQAKLWPLAISAWAGPFPPSRRPVFITKFKTDSAIASVLISIGLRLTDVMDLTTDDDALLAYFDTASGHTNWQIAESIGGTDTLTDSGVAVAASTNFTFAFVVREDGYGEVYIGTGKVLTRVYVTSGAMTAAAALKPQIFAVQTLTGAAYTAASRYAEISQDHE